MKVCIVDDEWLVRQGLRTLMPWEAFGMEVTEEASDGEEALAAASAQDFDVMFIDLTMPVMDGFELMREMRSRYSHIYIVVLTCHQDFEYVQEAMRLGAIDYLVKIKLNKDQMAKSLKRISERIAYERDRRLNQGQSRGKSENNPNAITFSEQMKQQGYAFLSLDFEQGPEQLYSLEWVQAQDLIRVREGLWYLSRTGPDSGEKEVSSFLHGIQGPSWVLLKVAGVEDKHVGQISRLLLTYVEEAFFYAYHPLSQVYEVLLDDIVPAGPLDEMKKEELGAAWRSFHWLFDDRSYSELLQQVQAMRLSGPYLWGEIQKLGGYYEALFQRSDPAERISRLPHPFSTWMELGQWLEKTREVLARRLAEQFPVEIVRNITKAVAYLERHMGDRVSQDEAASIASMSRSYFSVCFKQVTGQTFSDCLKEIRLNKARLYLLQTDEPIQWIASYTGFQDEKYFSKVFKAKTGMLPTVFRKRHR